MENVAWAAPNQLFCPACKKKKLILCRVPGSCRTLPGQHLPGSFAGYERPQGWCKTGDLDEQPEQPHGVLGVCTPAVCVPRSPGLVAAAGQIIARQDSWPRGTNASSTHPGTPLGSPLLKVHAGKKEKKKKKHQDKPPQAGKPAETPK